MNRLFRRESAGSPEGATGAVGALQVGGEGSEKASQGRAVCQEYWGATGKLKRPEELEAALRALDLSVAEMHEIRRYLPVHTSGPSGDRARSADRLLRGMQKAIEEGG